MERLLDCHVWSITNERWLAAILAFAVNAAVAWFLLQPPAFRLYEPDVRSDFLEVIFVDRTSARPDRPPTPSAESSTALGRQKAEHGQPTSAPLTASTLSAEVVSQMGSLPTPLNLQLPEEPLQLRDHNPLKPARALAAPRDPQLQVNFVDRSLGGQLQRMSRSAACRELGQALTENPASAESILASMQRYKCGS